MNSDYPVLELLYQEGLCTDLPPDLFFPEEDDHEAITDAKAICAICPVLAECQTHSLANEEFGIWGGLTERERRSTRRRRSNR